MSRSSLIVALLVVFPSIASAKLEISNIQAAHGVFGPERANLDVYPLDEVLFRYVVSGVKTDADGRTDVEMAFKLLNSEGKALVDQRGPIQRPLMLGGDRFSAHTQIGIGPNAAPGKYELVVTLTDRRTGDTASFQRTLTCKAPQFQILAPRFSHDAEGKLPASTSGYAGESLFFRIKVVGYEHTANKVHAVMTMQLLDEAGKPVSPKPMVVNAELTRPEDVQKALQLNFNGGLGLNRPGNFVLRITVDDMVGKQSTTFETPIKVAMP